jgi:hypothetical protein
MFDGVSPFNGTNHRAAGVRHPFHIRRPPLLRVHPMAMCLGELKSETQLYRKSAE